MADFELLDDELENEEILSKVEIFLQNGCGCSYGAKGGQCSQQFSKEAVLFNVNNCLELSHGELDLVILANIQASTNFETTGKKRKRSPCCSFLYLNCLVCKDMFLRLYGISYSRFHRLKEHYEEYGLSPRVHGNHKRLPHNALPQAVTEDVKNFLMNYVDENAILLPGRIPGYKTMTFACFRRARLKCMYGVATKKYAKKRGNRLLATLRSQNYGNNFIQTLSSPNP